MRHRPTVVWFRRDLRVGDNTAVAHAVERRGAIVPLFVQDPRLWNGRAPAREAWLAANLGALDAELRRRGARLVVRRGDPTVEIPRLAREVDAAAVVWARDYTPFARQRDAQVANACEAIGLEVSTVADAVLVEPDALRTGSGRAYTVFTPYHRAWAAVARPVPRSTPARIPMPATVRGLPLPAPGAVDLPEPGERAARAALREFVARRLGRYATDRDRLDRDATSRLSLYLRFGALSPRQIVTAVERAVARERSLATAAAAFVRQLAWREFFTQTLWHVPDSQTLELRADRRRLAWRDDPEGLAAWREGRTGYPLVDAGMRELAATGFMHNRARLVTAGFLTKHLLVDWRAGARWFMARLLDGDPAVNTGNWQWVASTGADAMPAFRIFNPTIQARRFDPDGAYVRRWVPEAGTRHYPMPIVEHEAARARALRVLAARRGSGA